jgi:hypothetical protein
VESGDRLTRRSPKGESGHRHLRQLYSRFQERRGERTEGIELDTYRFWHLDYGEVAYYDQLVFKRHRPIPPLSASASPSRSAANGPQ